MKKIFLILLIFGIVLRFVLQFLFPVFNVDEISLGNNIKHLNFIELLYPLQYAQSSPPLFLWVEKIIISVFPFSFWINIKILSFISSVTSLVLFYSFAKKYDFKELFLVLFIVFAFNPFNINNSLTVKQYTIDLTGILFLLVYFKTTWFTRHNWLFFMFWSLMSNIGLFACVGFLLYSYVDQNKTIKFSVIFSFVKIHLMTFLAPIPYVIYFLWFIQQKGAIGLKEYMVIYWSSSFIPLNATIFNYLLYMIHGLWIFILNSFEFWGMFLMILMLPFFIFYRKKVMLFTSELSLLFCILLVHLVLNILHMYPFSDRLYLYLSPFFLLILGSSLGFLSKLNRIKKYFLSATVFVSIITFLLYLLYIPATDNDIVSLNKKLNKLNIQSVYVSNKSNNCIRSFNQFTDNKFEYDGDLILLDANLDKSNFIVSRVAKKIKMNISSPEEKEIQLLIDSHKIIKIDKVNGYNIYKVI